jgi:putative transposase
MGSPTPVTTCGEGKYGGMSVSDAKRLKELELENTRLKKLLADSLLENEVTREALRRKW